MDIPSYLIGLSMGEGGGSTTASWGQIQGNIDNQTDLKQKLDSAVHKAGDETITGNKHFNSITVADINFTNNTIESGSPDGLTINAPEGDIKITSGYQTTIDSADDIIIRRDNVGVVSITKPEESTKVTFISDELKWNTENIATQSYVTTAVSEKSKVTASDTGTSTNTVNYITIDDTEYKLPQGGSGSGATEDNFIFNNNLITMYNIGKITGASESNPITINAQGKTFKQVWNEIFVTELQPQIIKNASWTFEIYNDSNKDVTGAVIRPVAYVTFDPGEYTYNPKPTGAIIEEITATGCDIEKVTDYKYKITFPEKTIPSKYDAARHYRNSEGGIAKTNLGNDSDPEVKIPSATYKDSTIVNYTSDGSGNISIENPTLKPYVATLTEENGETDFAYSDVTGAVIPASELKFSVQYATPTGIYPDGYVGNPGKNVSAQCAIAKQSGKDMKLVFEGNTDYVDLTSNKYTRTLSNDVTVSSTQQTTSYQGTINYTSGTTAVIPLSPKGNQVPGWAIQDGSTSISGNVIVKSDGTMSKTAPYTIITINSPTGTGEVGTSINVPYTTSDTTGIYTEQHTGQASRTIPANCPITERTFTINDVSQPTGSYNYSLQLKDTQQTLNCKYEITYSDGIMPVTRTNHNVPSAQIAGSTSQSTKSITAPAGFRYFYRGYKDAANALDVTALTSAQMRGLNENLKQTDLSKDFSVGKFKQLFFAIPTSWGKKIATLKNKETSLPAGEIITGTPIMIGSKDDDNLPISYDIYYVNNTIQSENTAEFKVTLEDKA